MKLGITRKSPGACITRLSILSLKAAYEHLAKRLPPSLSLR